jgi:hypothetical protein
MAARVLLATIPLWCLSFLIMSHKEAVCGKKVDLVICDEADTLKRVHNGCMAVRIYHFAQGSCVRQKVDLVICDEADTLKRVHNGCMAVCIYHVAQGSCLRQKGGPGDMC